MIHFLCVKQLQYLQCNFLLFEAVLGLEIYMGKSEMVHVGEVENMGVLADILEYKISALPLKYLGLPSGVWFKAKTIWDDILKRM